MSSQGRRRQSSAGVVIAALALLAGAGYISGQTEAQSPIPAPGSTGIPGVESTPTATPTPGSTSTPDVEATPTSTPTPDSTPTITPTGTPIGTPAGTPTPTPTPTPSIPSPPPPEPEEDPYVYDYDDPPSPPPISPPPPPVSPGTGPGPSTNPSPPPMPPPPPPPSPPPPPAQAPPSELIRGDGDIAYSSPMYAYSIDWDTVPDSPPDSNPQTDMSITEVGNCACDLTLNGCNSNCCCDPDCNDEQKSLFTNCFPEGPQPPMLEYCISETLVAEVNLPSSSSFAVVYKQAANPESFLDQLICIEDDNNPVFGVYFMDPPPGTAADLDNPPESWPTAPADADDELDRDNFLVGDSMRAYYSSSSGAFPVPGGVFTVPTARYTAMCDAGAVVGFGLNTPFTSQVVNRCQQFHQSLEEVCQDSTSSPLSGLLLVDNLELAVARTGSARKAVQVTEILFRNLDGSLDELDTAAGLPGLSYDSNICNNTVLGVSYTVVYTVTGTIASVRASVTLGEVEGTVTGGAAFDQTFSVRFTDEAQLETRRPTSGSPGYMPGFPLVAGVEVMDPEAEEDDSEARTAIQRLIGGLPIPVGAINDGTCGAEHTEAAIFGSNTVSSCFVPLTYDQLKSFCSGNPQDGAPASTPAIPLQLIRGLLNPDQPLSVGRWGNSDALNTGEWVQIVQDSNATSMTWSNSTSTCSGVIAGVEFQFLTSFVGAANNPQSQISYARTSYIRSDWVFSNAFSPGSPQNFEIKHFVKFVAQDQPPAVAVRGNTPFLLPSLPADFFYPFTSTSTRTFASVAVAVAAVTSLLAFLLVL